MKKFVILLMIIQVILLCYGITLLFYGNLGNGIIIVVLNTAFFMLNIDTLKKL